MNKVLSDKQIVISALRIYARHLSLVEPTEITQKTRSRALVLLKSDSNIEDCLDFTKEPGEVRNLKDWLKVNQGKIYITTKLSNFIGKHGDNISIDNISIKMLRLKRNFGPTTANELMKLLSDSDIKYYS